MGLSTADSALLVSRDLLVTCRNSLGVPVRATPVRLDLGGGRLASSDAGAAGMAPFRVARGRLCRNREAG